MSAEIKYYKIPVWIVFIASSIPIIGQLLAIKFKPVEYLGPFITTICLLPILTRIKLSLSQIWLLRLLCFYVVCVTVAAVGIGSGGTLIIFYLSTTFLLIFRSAYCNPYEQLMNLRSLMIGFFKFIIVFSYFELVVVVFGFQNILYDLLTQSDILPGYKNYNHAHFLNAIGFRDVTGLGGIYLGSQAAGMMSAIALVFFLTQIQNIKNSRSWIFLSFFSLAFCSNMTSLVMFFAGVFFIAFVFKTNLNNKFLKFAIIFLAPFFIPIVFFKIDNVYEYENYIVAFTPALTRLFDNISALNFSELLFGYGSVGHDYLSSLGEPMGTDLGLITLINQAGIFIFIIALFVVVRINIYCFHLPNRMAYFFNQDLRVRNIYTFYVSNVVAINMLFISLLHYTSAVEVGIRELFALHISVCLYIPVFFRNYQVRKL